MVLLCQTAAPWDTLGGQGAPMNSMPNPEHTNPYDVVDAALQACQQIGRADRQLPRANEPVSNLEPDSARHPSELQKRLAVPPHRSSLGGLALKGLGLLVAASIGAAAMVLRSHGDADKQVTALLSAAASPVPAQSSPSPEQEQLLQSMARGFVAVVEQGIDELKTGIEQLKTSQEQMIRNNSAVAEQLKAAQEQMVRDNSAVAEQLKATQEEMARLIAKASEQQLHPKTSAPPPRPIATPTGKPVPKLSSLQVRARPLAPVQGHQRRGTNGDSPAH
jgi:hypothetical protein